MEAKIDELIRLGQVRGYLTFEQVDALLTEHVTVEDIDRLLERLENARINLLGAAEVPLLHPEDSTALLPSVSLGDG